MSSDLVQFLKRRLDEDEEIAKDPTHATWATAEWRFSDAGNAPYVDLGTNHLDSVSSLNESEMRHIARHDPARVLAEVDAKRELLSRYEAMVADVLVVTGREAILSEYRRVILPSLALPYADHPGYRAEWRP
ncbi:DUF6221 family protein [Streptomyces sp. NPDC057428]|uniref:DUF6221 family protein n=1 Tax=Streptomyces sp. NPDC057428 TaxID=3346129 RepID=UPI00368CC5F6